MSVSKGKYRLSNMSLDFVSLVPAGDDPMAQVVLSKADPELGNDNDPQEGNMGDKIAKDDLDPEVVAYIDGLEDEIDTLSKSVEDLQTALSDAEASGSVVKSEEEQHAALLAKADPAVRVLLEKQAADLKAANEIAKAERDARMEREYIAKAEKMPMINTDKAALGGLLRRISDALSTEDAAEVEKMLAAANEQIAKGSLFDTFGTSGEPSTVSKSIESAAQELMKADPNLTMEQAQAKVYETNPALFADAMTQEG